MGSRAPEQLKDSSEHHQPVSIGKLQFMCAGKRASILARQACVTGVAAMPEPIFLSGLIRRILLPALLLSFLLSPSLSQAQKWVEIRSPHFVVDTDAGDKRGREVALHFEQMRTIFGQLLSKLTVNVPV